MRRLAVLAVMLGVVGGVRSDDPKKADQFQGDWKVVSVTRDGKEDPTWKGGSRVLEGHKFTLNPPETSKVARVQGTFEVDTSKSPAYFDMIPTSGRYKDQRLKGIAKVEEDRLTICYAEPGKPRPTDFESKPGSGHVLAVHKKAR